MCGENDSGLGDSVSSLSFQREFESCPPNCSKGWSEASPPRVADIVHQEILAKLDYLTIATKSDMPSGLKTEKAELRSSSKALDDYTNAVAVSNHESLAPLIDLSDHDGVKPCLKLGDSVHYSEETQRGKTTGKVVTSQPRHVSNVFGTEGEVTAGAQACTTAGRPLLGTPTPAFPECSLLDALKIAERRRPVKMFDGTSKDIDFQDHLRMFIQAIDLPALTSADKLREMRHWFDGQAIMQVACFFRIQDTDRAFEGAIERLRERYANFMVTAEEMLGSVMKGETIETNDYDAINGFICQVEDVYVLAQETGRDKDFNRSLIIRQILNRKLPFLKWKWATHVVEKGLNSNEFSHFMEFLRRQERVAREMNDICADLNQEVEVVLRPKSTHINGCGKHGKRNPEKNKSVARHETSQTGQTCVLEVPDTVSTRRKKCQNDNPREYRGSVNLNKPKPVMSMMPGQSRRISTAPKISGVKQLYVILQKRNKRIDADKGNAWSRQSYCTNNFDVKSLGRPSPWRGRVDFVS